MQLHIPFKHLDIVQLPCMFIHTQMLACCLCYIASHLNILMFFGPICIPFKYARLIMRLSLGATERLLHCDLEVTGLSPGNNPSALCGGLRLRTFALPY